ncbi:MAG: alpha/beta hydrolase [Clostridia bacterium]|nr:alpha/beta hydrolase [Clostridia bacterium]
MRHECIVLPETGVELETYLTDNRAVEPERRRPLALIFPGGGYHFRSDREAEPVALRLLGLGIQAVIVRYSVAPARYPQALREAAEAVAYAHAHAEEWLCDARKVAVLGFSAGGHAAAHIGVRWQEQKQGAACRPDAMILCYPVITSGPHAHRGSIDNLLGEEQKALIDAVSLEKHVSDQTPPTFLWHTWEDEGVPVENSLLLACALREHGVPCEMHIYQRGGHGMSLSNDEVYPPWHDNIHPECQGWIDMAARWLKQL